MEVVDVPRPDLHPAGLLHVVDVADTAGVRVAVSGVVDGALAQVDGLVDGQVGAVVRVEDAIRVGRARADREEVAMEARRVVVAVVELRAGLVPAGDHGAHAETVAAVLVHGVGEQLGRRRHADALLVPQLVQPALHAQVPLPVGTVRRAASHGAEQVRVDLDDLLDGLRRNVGAHRRARVHGDDDALVEFEGEGGGALGELHSLLRVGAVPHAKVLLRVRRRIGHRREHKAVRRRSHHLLQLITRSVLLAIRPGAGVQDVIRSGGA
mmetsp:Transcript_26298/g.70141  ORF Transcript_26298/g.70141 Transcript_26298/m.70141 type:complete len:267 (-) Transcript_26298:50-850(-)